MADTEPVDGFGLAVVYLGQAVSGELHVAWLQVPVDDAPTVRELQAPAGLLGDVDGMLKRETVVCGVFDYSLHIPVESGAGRIVRR